MIDEERLSRLLHDPGWSLPPWPPGQATARIRRAARRQRLLAVCRGAAVTVIAGAVALTAISHVAHGATRPAASTPAITGPRPDHAQVLPQVGSSGFPRPCTRPQPPSRYRAGPPRWPAPRRPAFSSRAREPPPRRSPACAPWAQNAAASCSSRTGRSGRSWRTADGGPRWCIPCELRRPRSATQGRCERASANSPACGVLSRPSAVTR